MKYEVWDLAWLDSDEATDERFIAFILNRDDGIRGREHRMRLQVLFAWYREHLDLPRIVVQQAYEEVRAAMWLDLHNRAYPLVPPPQTLYRIFYQNVRQNLFERKRTINRERVLMEKKKRELQLFLFGSEVSG